MEKSNIKVIIQCAGKKERNAKSFCNSGGRILFRAKPDSQSNSVTPWSHIQNTSMTWIDCVQKYNGSGVLPDGIFIENNAKLARAGDLYLRSAYRELINHFDYNSVFILSAGWGLVRGDTKIPAYDITFSNQAEKDCRITPTERSGYGTVLSDVGECDKLHLFITKAYLDYWNRAFTRYIQCKNIILHWNESFCPSENYTIARHNFEPCTNWHYKAVSQYMNQLTAVYENPVSAHISTTEISSNHNNMKNKTDSACLFNDTIIEQENRKITTYDIYNYICDALKKAKLDGKMSIQIKSGDLHKALGLKNRMPMVCNAMKRTGIYRYKILQQTDSGFSSTLLIEYYLQ
jgi:hypothetical protein